MGSYVQQFEEALQAYLELPPERGLAAVNTCTSALHLALLLAGVGEGDEVITPAFNNIGDFQAIAMCGASPVFVDIRADNLGLDPEAIEALIGPRTRAIIALHYAGVPCARDALYEVAGRHGLRVIEDAAHALGTRVGGRPIGSTGDLACFSFDPIKTLTCIDGGLVVTPDRAQAGRLYPLRLLGMTQDNARLYAHSRASQCDVYGPGYRYHLANLHAAVGLTQLERLPEFIHNRRQYCLLYDALLSGIPEVTTPVTDLREVSPFLYTIRVHDGRRGELVEHLRARGIETGVHWQPGHWFSWLRGARGAAHLPVTEQVGREILSLPLWSYMPASAIAQVAEAIASCFRRPTGAALPATGAVVLSRAKLEPLSIPLPGGSQALRSVVTADPSEADVTRLTEWRNRHVNRFLTEFVATPERTRRWLQHIVHADAGRILFMIEGPEQVIGYIGLAFIDWQSGEGEVDSLVRGAPGSPGIMAEALRALLAWARAALGLSRFTARLLSDNERVLRFFDLAGFVAGERTPLVRVGRPDCTAWEPAGETDPAAPRWLVHMELPPPPCDDGAAAAGASLPVS